MGLAIAVALLVPNLVWQAQHGWPSLHFFASQNAKTASDTSRFAYLAEQLLFLGATSMLAAAGVVWLWRRGLRALALIPVLVTAIFFLESGRSYYPLPADALAVPPERSPSRGGCTLDDEPCSSAVPLRSRRS